MVARKTKSRLLWASLIMLLHVSCGGDVNSLGDSHFTHEGIYISDTTTSLVMAQPNKVKFYVEVSGSMNGFFRANKPTHFKADVWQIMGYFSPIAPDVTVLTNSGNSGTKISLLNFQTKMNTGGFISQASTKVPVMLETILSELNSEEGEVAILISDMKYSPVGSAAPTVLMTQYSTDVSRILANYNQSISLVCATSNFLSSNGTEVCSRSPYYYLILGKDEYVTEVRNNISTLLKDRNHFVDNIDSGINYGTPQYSFGSSYLCDRLDNEPTFVAYEEHDASVGDTCTIKLKLDIRNYRWLLEYEPVLRRAFEVKPLYGSNVKVGKISYDIETKENKQLKRKAEVTIELKICDMPLDMDVIEWNLNIPDSEYTMFNEFFEGAVNENDPTKSYSVLEFIHGIFYGGILNQHGNSNYILISKNG